MYFSALLEEDKDKESRVYISISKTHYPFWITASNIIFHFPLQYYPRIDPPVVVKDRKEESHFTTITSRYGIEEGDSH
jgi:hypothetical protein